jgi:hypothetical protein
LLFRKREFAAVRCSFKDKWGSSDACRENALFDVESARSSSLAFKSFKMKSFEGKLKSAFVFK